MNEGNELSAIVIAQDSEETIARCVRSLDFAEEVVVVDGGSRDATREIAARFGARVVESPWPGFALQRERALREARHPWIISLDTDEEVSDDLRAEIKEAVTDFRHDGYFIPRKNQFLGKWVRHGAWTQDAQLRLFRKELAGVDMRPVHEGFHVEGRVGRLAAPIYHYTHPTLEASFERMNRYTSLEAGERAARGPVRLHHLIFKPAAVFFKYAVILGGWRDGIRGLLLAATTAVYKGALLAKAWELQNSPGAPERDGDDEIARRPAASEP